MMLHEYIESKSPLTPRERNLICGAWIAARAVVVESSTRVAEQRDAPVHAEQNGASELVCIFDNDGGGIDIDVLKKFLNGKHGWLTAQSHANGEVKFSMTPHSNRSAGG